MGGGTDGCVDGWMDGREEGAVGSEVVMHNGNGGAIGVQSLRRRGGPAWRSW